MSLNTLEGNYTKRCLTTLAQPNLKTAVKITANLSSNCQRPRALRGRRGEVLVAGAEAGRAGRALLVRLPVALRRALLVQVHLLEHSLA